MARRDDFHFVVRRALEKEGWVITHDPLPLLYEDLSLQADLGAERTFAAEKAGRKIAVEVKDFDSGSAGSELQKVVGQMQFYQGALEDQEPDRELFLAVSYTVYDMLFQRPSFQRAVRQNAIKLIVFDDAEEVNLQWIKTLKYADILTEILRARSNLQFSNIPGLKLVSSCDRETGQFLLILLGWDNRKHWHHTITFHAQLLNGKVRIILDMTEGLKPHLLEAGIRAEDFLSNPDYDYSTATRAAA